MIIVIRKTKAAYYSLLILVTNIEVSKEWIGVMLAEYDRSENWARKSIQKNVEGALGLFQTLASISVDKKYSSKLAYLYIT